MSNNIKNLIPSAFEALRQTNKQPVKPNDRDFFPAPVGSRGAMLRQIILNAKSIKSSPKENISFMSPEMDLDSETREHPRMKNKVIWRLNTRENPRMKNKVIWRPNPGMKDEVIRRPNNPAKSRYHYRIRTMKRPPKEIQANVGDHMITNSRTQAFRKMLGIVTKQPASDSSDPCVFQCTGNKNLVEDLSNKAVHCLEQKVTADLYDDTDIYTPISAMRYIYDCLDGLLWCNDVEESDSGASEFDSYIHLEDDIVTMLYDIQHSYRTLDHTISEIHSLIRSYRSETERSILESSLVRILKRVYEHDAVNHLDFETPDHFSKGARILAVNVSTSVMELCYDKYYDTSSSCSLEVNGPDDTVYFQSGLVSSLLGTSQMTEDMKLVGERVTDTLDRCNSLVGTVEDLVNKVHSVPVLDDNFDLVDYLKRRLSIDLSPGESFLLDTTLVVLVLSGAYTVYRHPTLLNKTFLITLSAALCARRGYEIGTKLSALLIKWSNTCTRASTSDDDEVAHFESGVDMTVFHSILTLLTTLMEFKNFTNIEGVMSALRRIPKTTDSISTMIESFKFFIYWLQGSLSTLTGGFIPSPLNPTGDVEAEDFSKNAVNLQESFSTGHLLMTKGTTTIVMHQIKLGEQILMRLTRLRKPVLASYVTRHVVGLRKILDNIAKFTLNRSVVRPEPAVLLLVGGPGTGKSVAMRMIETSLMREITTGAEYVEYCNNNSLYSFHRMKPSYWEGVTRQCKAIIYDDFMQVREIAGGESTACEFIKLVNTAPFVPDMAFGDKGSIFLEPRFVIATTNMNNMNSEAIIDRGALTRRMHVRVQVSVKPEFACNGKVDPTKVPIIRSDIYEFRQFDYSDNGSILMHGPLLSLEQVTKLVKAKMDSNLVFSESLSTACINFASGLDHEDEDGDPMVKFDEFMSNYTSEKEVQMEHVDSDIPSDLLSHVSDSIEDIHGIRLNDVALSNFTSHVIGDKYKRLDSSDYFSVAKRIVKAGRNWFRLEADPAMFQVCEHASAISDVVLNPWKRAFSLITEKWFVGSVFGTTVLAGLYYAFNGSSTIEADADPPVNVEYGKKVEYAFKRGAKATYQKPIRFTTHQDTNPNNGLSFEAGNSFGNSEAQDLVTKYTKNLYEVTHDDKHFGWAIALTGGTFMMPYHFCTSICNVSDETGLSSDYAKVFTFTNVITDATYSKTVGDILSKGTCVPERDILCFDIKCKPHTDIVNNFVSKTAFERFSSTTSRKENGFLFTERGVFNFDNATYARSLSACLDGGMLKVDDVIRYSCSSMAGDCGMPLVFNYKDGHKIVGAHFAGSKTHGFSVVITKELLNTLLKRDNIDDYQLIDNVLPRTSTFVKSSITSVQHGLIPYRDHMVTTPVHSEANYLKELSKYKRPQVTADMSLVSACANSYYDSINARSSNATSKRVYEIDEAIFGIEGDTSFGPLDRSTSMGWPFSGRKSVVMGLDRTIKPGSEYIIERITEMIDHYADGCRPFIAYGDFTKDEKLPIHKVEAGKIRLISGSPFDYLVVTRMFFGAFTHHIMKHGLDFGMAITVNPYSSDWSTMFNAMIDKSGSHELQLFGAGDFKGFDKSQVREIMLIVFSIIEKWYGDSDPVANKIRALIFEDITDSIHIRGSKVHMWHTSLPSGNPLTTVLNSLYNHVAMRYCWLRLHENSLSSLLHYDDNVQLYVVGDDHVFSTTPQVANVYNEANLVPYMKELGLVYTSDLKKEDIHVGLRFLKEVTFLKRRFILDNTIGRVLAPLDLNVVTEIPLWTKNDDLHIACDNASTAMRELSLHSESVFDEWSLKIIEMYSGVWVPESTDYRTIQSNVLSLTR